MTSPRATRRLLAVTLLALAAVVAGCGGASSSPSAAASASAATSSAAPSSATSPSSAASSGDPLLDVAIGVPYALVELPAAKADAIQAGIEKNLGAYGKAVHVGVREITQGNATAAYLMVVSFPRGTLTDDIYGQIINNLSMGAEQAFTSKIISNVPVSFGTLSGGAVAVFRQGDLAMITLAPTAIDLTPIETALVKANG